MENFKRQCTIFTLNLLCNTLGIPDCSKPLRYQIAKIHDALVSVTEPSSDPTVKHEALTLSQQICDFSFIFMPVIWYRGQGDAIQYHGNKFRYATLRIRHKVLDWMSSSKSFKRAVVDVRILAKSLDVDIVVIRVSAQKAYIQLRG
jgi:hypothetical protein